MSTPNAANIPTPPMVKMQAHHHADPIHHKNEPTGPKGEPSSPSAPSFVNSTRSFPPSTPSAQTTQHDDHNNDKIFDECAVENVSDVNEDTIKNAIELLRRESNNGEIEDVEVVLVRKGVTEEDLVVLVGNFECEMQRLKMEIQEGGKLVIMECHAGQIHGRFLHELCHQVGVYTEDSGNLPMDTLSAMTDGMAGGLGGTSPDIGIDALIENGNPDRRARVVIEVEHRNRSIPKLRKHGLRLFRDGQPYMRAFVGIKLIGDATTGMSAIAVCYCKNDADTNIIEITDVVSFGSEEPSDQALHYWTVNMDDGLGPVNRTGLTGQQFLHPHAASIEIPLNALLYEVPGVEGNGADLAEVTGLDALRIDLRKCFRKCLL